MILKLKNQEKSTINFPSKTVRIRINFLWILTISKGLNLSFWIEGNCKVLYNSIHFGNNAQLNILRRWDRWIFVKNNIFLFFYMIPHAALRVWLCMICSSSCNFDLISSEAEMLLEISWNCNAPSNELLNLKKIKNGKIVIYENFIMFIVFF